MTTSQIDDTIIGEVTTGVLSYPVVLIAHEIGLFKLLGHGSLTKEEIASGLNIRPRSTDAILSICCAAELLELRAGKYQMTQAGAEYLLPDSPVHWCHYFDFLVANANLFSYDTVRSGLLRDEPQIHQGEDVFEVNKVSAERAAEFTRWMHSVSMGPAMRWPEKVDLSSARMMLDIAGGSGAHSICAAKTWPLLKCAVLDLEPVCRLADAYVAEHELQDRVSTISDNMWKAPFPPADVNFYSQIFHDWGPNECLTLAQKSFNSLAPNGKVIIHELLYNDDKTGPLRVASVNLLMSLLYAEGRQYSSIEIINMLTSVGFVDAEVIQTFGYWGVVVARKP